MTSKPPPNVKPPQPAKSPPPMKPPTNLIGYVLDRPLGKGGMGTVWVARRTSTDQEFAVKFLKEEYAEDPTYLARFEREVAALRAIRHPNVVDIFEWSMPRDLPGSKPYVVMELLQGEGLDQFVRRQRIVPPRLAVKIMLQILDGLGAAHNVGVVHRDLGPSNVFLSPQSAGSYLVRVLDFGLARPLVSDGEDGPVTQAGTLIGKPGYMAPESFIYEGGDRRADLFACGMMLFRMLAGRLPYRESKAQLLWAERLSERHHNREYVSIREFAGWLPERLALVVTKAVRRNPEERYRSTEEMQLDLMSIDDGLLLRAGEAVPSLAAAPSVPDTSSSVAPGSLTGTRPDATLIGRRKSVALGVALSLVVVLAVATALLVWRPWAGDETPSAAGNVAGSSDATAVVLASVADAAAAAPGPELGPVSPPAAEDAATAVEVAAADAAPPPGEADANPTVLVVLAGVPEGATVKVGELVPEGDPPKVRVPRTEELLEVVVEAPGYRKFTELVLPTIDRLVNVRLEPIRATSSGGTRRPPRDAGPREAGTAAVVRPMEWTDD